VRPVNPENHITGFLKKLKFEAVFIMGIKKKKKRQNRGNSQNLPQKL
jgi:hypothetical protein